VKGFSEAVRDFSVEDEIMFRLRMEAAGNIERARERCREQPDNIWAVYELCKQLADWYELDNVNFKSMAKISKKLKVYAFVPWIDYETLEDGVYEYHESVMERMPAKNLG